MALDRDALAKLKMSPETTTAAPRGFAWKPNFKAKRFWLALLVAALVLGMCFKPKSPTVSDAEVLPPPTANRPTVLNASGYVIARRLATVASKVTGRLVEVKVDEGMVVKEGQELARLDSSVAMMALRQAQAQREAAALALKETDVRLADATRNADRQSELLARHLVAQSVADTALADKNSLQAHLEQLKAELNVAQAQVNARQQDVTDLIIRAPFDGVVITKDAQPGEMVSPISAGGGFTRTGIATVVDMASRELEVDVNEAFIQKVHEGQAVEAALDAYPNEPIPAHVRTVVPTADKQKATVKVRIVLEQLSPKVLPDMGVKVRFLSDDAVHAEHVVALVPKAALVNDSGQTVVFVFQDGRAKRRVVKLGAAWADDQLILDGLAPKERVIVNPPQGLSDGSAVVVAAH